MANTEDETVDGSARAQEWETLDTDTLKRRALALARQRGDVAFVWDLLRHLPQSVDFVGEDGATTGITTSINDLLGAAESLFGHNSAGSLEPMFRATFIDYLIRHQG